MAGALVLAVAGTLLGLRYGIPRAADVMTVRTAPFQQELRGPGILDALSKASVSPSMQGVLTALRVDTGDHVRTGDVIAEIGADDLKAQLEAAEASHEAAVKAVELAQADRRRAEATRANARSTLDRQQELIRSGATSRSALESAQTALEQSLADLAKADAAIRQAQAAEASAAAAVKVSRAQLDKSVIRAPIDALVVARKANVGDLVSPGTVIVELVDPRSVVLSARFDESIIAAVDQGQGARLLFSSGGDGPTDGTVRRLGREVDTETREFTVDISPARLPKNWALGQRGTAILLLSPRPETLTVPVAALAARPRGPGVYVLRDGRAIWQAIAPGAVGEARVEVREGLKAGDVVLLQPERAFPRMAVDPRAPAS